MRHAHTVFRARSGKADEVFGTDVGRKDGCTDDVPRFAFTEKVVLAIGALHFLFVFFDGAINRPYDGQDSDGQHRPVEPDEFICSPIHGFVFCLI